MALIYPRKIWKIEAVSIGNSRTLLSDRSPSNWIPVICQEPNTGSSLAPREQCQIPDVYLGISLGIYSTDQSKLCPVLRGRGQSTTALPLLRDNPRHHHHKTRYVCLWPHFWPCLSRRPICGVDHMFEYWFLAIRTVSRSGLSMPNIIFFLQNLLIDRPSVGLLFRYLCIAVRDATFVFLSGVI